MSMNTTIPDSTCENNFLKAALSYARRGLHVFPVHSIHAGCCTCDDPDCSSPGKHPLTPRGLLDATTDERTIRRWWDEAPTANVGIRTGPESGIWVLGPDGEAGIQALQALEAVHGPLPATITARSGGGGRHYYFSWPADGGVRNAANHREVPIDIRGQGGYVLAPPSMHRSGQCYEWIASPDAIELAVAPPWLVDWASSGTGSASPTSNGQGASSLLLRVQADDLRTAPGVAEGGRHDALCQLVGHHVGRGEDLAAIDAAAMLWASRCTPPMSPDETRKVVQDLHRRRDARSVSASTSAADDVDEIELPPAKPWPTLADAALYGLAGDVVRRIGPQTEASLVAILMHFLTFFGNLIGRTAHAVVEDSQHFCNLFAVIVGATSIGRKGSSSNRTKRLFRHGNAAEWLGTRVQSGLSSGEGLIWHVRDPIMKTEPRKESGRIISYEEVLADPGVADKRLLVEEPEFCKVLKSIRRENNVLSATMRQAWDSGDLRTLTKNSPAVATGSHISVVGHITENELIRCLNETEVANGFANRILWVLVRRSKFLPNGGQPVVVADFVARLDAAVEFSRRVGEITRDREAAELWCREYRRLSAGNPGMLGAVTSRAEAQVLRLSLIFALLDQSSVVRPPHLHAALAVWAYCEQSARHIFGTSSGDPEADRILALVRSSPGISRSEIYQASAGHLLKKILVDVLAKLRDDGLIYVVEQPTRGRPAERWYPADYGCEISERSEISPSSQPLDSPEDLNSHNSLLSQPTTPDETGGTRADFRPSNQGDQLNSHISHDSQPAAPDAAGNHRSPDSAPSDDRQETII